MSRIESRSTRCMRLISAHCSTPTTRLLLARADAQARVRTQPDTPDPAPGGSLFDRRRWVSIQAAPTTAHCKREVVASGKGACERVDSGCSPEWEFGLAIELELERSVEATPGAIRSRGAHLAGPRSLSLRSMCGRAL